MHLLEVELALASKVWVVGEEAKLVGMFFQKVVGNLLVTTQFETLYH